MQQYCWYRHYQKYRIWRTRQKKPEWHCRAHTPFGVMALRAMNLFRAIAVTKGRIRSYSEGVDTAESQVQVLYRILYDDCFFKLTHDFVRHYALHHA